MGQHTKHDIVVKVISIDIMYTETRGSNRIMHSNQHRIGIKLYDIQTQIHVFIY